MLQPPEAVLKLQPAHTVADGGMKLRFLKHHYVVVHIRFHWPTAPQHGHWPFTLPACMHRMPHAAVPLLQCMTAAQLTRHPRNSARWEPRGLPGRCSWVTMQRMRSLHLRVPACHPGMSQMRSAALSQCSRPASPAAPEVAIECNMLAAMVTE